MSITITGASLAEIVAQVAELTGGAAAPADKADKPARGGKKEDKKEELEGPTVEEIRELAGQIEKDEDQDAAVELLSKHGAESISDLGKKSATIRQEVFDGIKAILKPKRKLA